MRAIAGLLLVALSGACGYRPLHALHAGEQFSVVVVSSSVTDAIATDEVASGVREELLRARAFASGEGYPRAEIEVLRLDEASESIGVAPSGAAPEARSLRLGVVARAWIVRAKDGPRERDTGDVRALEVTSVVPDAQSAMFAAQDTQRASARRVGHRLGARLLGLPSASD
jgi:hypothetical protein